MQNSFKKISITILTLLTIALFGQVFAFAAASASSDNEYVIQAGKIEADLEIRTGKTMLSGVKVAQVPATVANVKYDDLTEEEQYTFSDDTTVLTLKKEYLQTLENGTYYFTAQFLSGDYVAKVNIVTDNWVVRAAKGSVKENGNYVDVTLNHWDPDVTIAGRGFYSKPLDITKPIFIEIADFTQGEWIMFDLNKEQFSFEYFDQTNSTPGQVKLIYFPFNNATGEGYRVQGWKGFEYTTGTISVSDRVNQYNSNVFEFFIGEKKEDSYVKYNGVKISGFSTSVRREDFEGNTAYLGIMTAQSQDAKFTTNKTVNSVVPIFDDQNRETIYKLKSNTDLTFKVANVAANDLTIKYGDKTLVKGTDYTYENDTVVLKGSYLKTLSYTSELNFELSSGNTKSNVYFPTEAITSETVKIADGDSPIKYSKGADIEFNFVMGGEKFVGVVNTNDNKTLGASDYTFENGKLVIKASAVSAWSSGSYKLYLETEKSFIPFYVVHENFENGIKYTSGDSGAKVERTKVYADGANGILLGDVIDFTTEQTWKINVARVGEYYHSGKSTGSADSYIEFKFYDFNTFDYVVMRIRANADPADSSMRFKTWIDFAVENAEGEIKSLALNINAKNATVGEHTIKFVTTENTIKIVFDDSYDLTLENMENFNFSMMQLFVNTTAGYSWTMQNAALNTTKLEEAVKKAEGKESAAEILKEVNALSFTATQSQVDEYTAKLNAVKEEKRGCGGAVNAQSAIALILSLCAAGYVLIRKK